MREPVSMFINGRDKNKASRINLPSPLCSIHFDFGSVENAPGSVETARGSGLARGGSRELARGSREFRFSLDGFAAGLVPRRLRLEPKLFSIEPHARGRASETRYHAGKRDFIHFHPESENLLNLTRAWLDERGVLSWHAFECD